MKVTATHERSAEPGAKAEFGRAARGATERRAVAGARAAEPGNLALQAMYASGALRSELKVGAADDPAEQEADRLAAAVLGGASSSCACAPGAPPCPRCAAQAASIARRKPRAGRRDGGGRVGPLALGSGRSLTHAERSRFEPGFGADFGGVRVHDNAQAAASAATLNARAFSVDQSIAFGAGKYQPHTPEGQRLMAHELAHIALGHGDVRRDGGGPVCSADAPVCEAPTPGSASVVGDPAQVNHTSDFDPCKVEVGALSNYELLAEYRNALQVVNAGRDAPGYFDYRNLQRRLIHERDRRVDLGHAWLATMPAGLPDTVYQIVGGVAGSFIVTSVSGAVVSAKPEGRVAAPYMTWSQFQRFLQTHDIERVDANTHLMRTAPAASAGPAAWGLPLTIGGLYNAPGDLPLLWRNPQTSTMGAPGASIVWPPLPEVFSRPTWWANQPKAIQLDLLANAPAINPERASRMVAMLRAYRRAPDVPPRIDPIGSATPVKGGTAAVAVTDIPNLDQSLFPGASAAALPPRLRGRPGTSGGSVLTAVNPTAVDHAEHVALENLRRAIETAIGEGRLTRAQLRGRVVYVMVEQEPCASCASGSGGGRPGVLEQFAKLYPELTVEVRNMRTSRTMIYRSGVLLNPSSGTPPALPLDIAAATQQSVDAFFTPEYVRSLRYGGGLSGDVRAMGVSGAQGAALTALFAVAGSGIVMMGESGTHPDWAVQLGLSGTLGLSAGFVGASTDQLITSRLTGSMVRDIAATGTSRITPGLATGLGRLGGGAAGAMFVEGISMGLLEEREHSKLEVGVRMGRSGALGAGSIWAGAAVGTAVGGPIGFIVGLGVGAVLYYVGDKVVPGGRADWDAYEAGCQPRPVPRTPGSERFTPIGCFAADTLVLLASGEHAPIEEIALGDLVQTWNERTGTLEIRPVIAAHRFAAELLLSFRLDDGRQLRVTASHKLMTDAGWRAAGDLLPGDVLMVRDHDGPGLRALGVLAVAPDIGAGSVYDLNVEATHTYFAGGVLAHNKYI